MVESTQSEDSLMAQKREKNNSVHIYKGESGSAICSCSIGHPSKNLSEPEFAVSRSEVLDNEYLQREGTIIGKFCGNCVKILRSESE